MKIAQGKINLIYVIQVLLVCMKSKMPLKLS